ncbi:MAG: DUF3515 family protein [Nocardioidaceae bacterium]
MWLLVGCGTAVDVDAPSTATGQCSDLLASLPETVDGQERRDVSPEGAAAAAWGDPAILLRCGVRRPRALDADSQCAVVQSVGWFAQEQADGFRFTTIGRASNVDVFVPYDYEPAADALVDLAGPIRSVVPETRPCV